MRNIQMLKIPAEQYDSENCFSLFSNNWKDSQMKEIERKFLHGLVRFAKPKRILEIGVYMGGGTTILLNAIREFKNCEVISIDLEKGKEIGSFAKKMFPKSKNWKLFAGKDPSEIIEKIGRKKFDFCIIDTAHVHPVESLNFLTVLPFLSNNAIVVIHDLIFFSYAGPDIPKQISHTTMFATKLLFDSLCGTKLKVQEKYYFNNTPFTSSSNIGAVQITKDTKKYIQNAFSMLMFPWGILPDYTHIKLISTIIKKYYSKDNYKIFCDALVLNLKFIVNNFSYKINLKKLEDFSKTYENAQNVIFYGGGYNCKKILDCMKLARKRLPDEIWDINANLKSIQGITIKQPDFTPKERYKNSIIVITIINKAMANKIKNELSKCNFYKIYLPSEFIL